MLHNSTNKHTPIIMEIHWICMWNQPCKLCKKLYVSYKMVVHEQRIKKLDDKKVLCIQVVFFQSHRELYLLFSISNELSRSGRIDITEIVCQASSVERPVIVSVLFCRCLPSYTLSIISFWDLSQILGTLYFFFSKSSWFRILLYLWMSNSLYLSPNHRWCSLLMNEIL